MLFDLQRMLKQLYLEANRSPLKNVPPPAPLLAVNGSPSTERGAKEKKRTFLVKGSRRLENLDELEEKLELEALAASEAEESLEGYGYFELPVEESRRERHKRIGAFFFVVPLLSHEILIYLASPLLNRHRPPHPRVLGAYYLPKPSDCSLHENVLLNYSVSVVPFQTTDLPHLSSRPRVFASSTYPLEIKMSSPTLHNTGRRVLSRTVGPRKGPSGRSPVDEFICPFFKWPLFLAFPCLHLLARALLPSTPSTQDIGSGCASLARHSRSRSRSCS